MNRQTKETVGACSLQKQSSSQSFTPVIVIGAGRSGTNMLRDSLTSLSSFSTWPCDEINYIWRHGNRAYPSDQIPAHFSTPAVGRFIGSSFDKMASKTGCEFLVEKTCANSLRVPFVNASVPNAKYVFIVRNGGDVVASAMKRWGAKLDVKYLLTKARFVPISDIPYYGARYGMHRLKKLFSANKTLPTWGPIYDGMKDDMNVKTLEEVCALQWMKCVQNSQHALEKIGQENFISVRYEDFVRNPHREMSEIVDFIGVKVDKKEIAKSVNGVTDKSVGGGVKLLSSNKAVSEILGVERVII